MVDGAFQRAINSAETSDKVLPADYNQRCPRCGLPTFRTSAQLHMEPSENQEPKLKPGVDYAVAPMEWHCST